MNKILFLLSLSTGIASAEEHSFIRLYNAETVVYAEEYKQLCISKVKELDNPQFMAKTILSYRHSLTERLIETGISCSVDGVAYYYDDSDGILIKSSGKDSFLLFNEIKAR